MTITTVFDPPLPSDSPATFNTKAFSTLGDLNDWSTEANALAGTVNANKDAAAASASTASTAAGTATTKAAEALSSANIASTSAGTATTQAGIATTKAAEAAASAADAAATLAGKANLSGATFTGEVKAPAIQAEGTGPYLQAYDTDGPTDKKYWRWSLNGGEYKLENINDAYSSVVMTPVSFDASGNATFTSGLQADGSTLLKGTVFQEGPSESGYWFNHTGGGTNRKLANFQYIDGTFVLRYINDGFAGVAVTPLVIDNSGNSTFSGNVTVGGGTLGYGAGSGGTVTQATSKSTAVTLNKPSGQITMHNAALAAGASVDFQVNNTTVNGSTGDVIAITGGAFSWNCRIEAFEAGAAYFKVRVTNITGSLLSEAVAINFTVIKGSTT